MAQFTDNQGTVWTVAVHIPLLRRLKRETGDAIDFVAAFGPSVDRLADPFVLVQVLWICCESQALQLSLSEEEFAARLLGDVLDNASQALLNAVIDFFPRRKQNLLRSLLQLTAAQQDLLTQRLRELLDQLPNELPPEPPTDA